MHQAVDLLRHLCQFPLDGVIFAFEFVQLRLELSHVLIQVPFILEFEELELTLLVLLNVSDALEDVSYIVNAAFLDAKFVDRVIKVDHVRR